MKNKKFNLLVLFLGLFFFNSNAQNFTFENKLTCDVVVHYEMWDAGCNHCSSGIIAMNPGDIVMFTVCDPLGGDMCITIQSIGGCTVPQNHASLNVCHVMTPYGQTGALNNSCCGTSISYNVVYTPTDWTIN